MKKKIKITIGCIFYFSFLALKSYCQSYKDSIMIANSEKWDVVYKKGILTFSQAGPDQTFSLNLVKLDSGKVKHKQKDSSEIEYSGSGGLDQRKYMTIKKSRSYKLQAGTNENSTAALFAVTGESNLKRQTFLGKLTSKKDEDEDEMLSFTSTIAGTIKPSNAAPIWNFSIINLSKYNMQNNEVPFIPSQLPGGFLKSDKDSLIFERASFKADVVLVDAGGEHVAAAKYRKKPVIIWVRKDIDDSLRDAARILFSVMISAR